MKDQIQWECEGTEGAAAFKDGKSKGETVTLQTSKAGTVTVTASVDGKTSAPVTITITESTSSP